jgi:branched-chain amino acid transport system permease protein
MAKSEQFKLKHYVNYIGVATAAVVLGALSLAGVLSSSWQIIFENIAISIMLAVSLSMVVGFLGELSIGHAGFMCVGAYLGGKTVFLLEPIIGDIPALLVGLVVGGALAALCGVVIGLPALRLRGDYLAIVTLAFGEIVWSIFMNTGENTFGGALGMPTVRIDKDYLFIIALALVLVCLAVIQNLIRSKHGRAITSIRDNEIAAKATGINVTKYKLLVFTISAFFAGIAGVLFASANYTVQSMKFNYSYSIEILVMVVLGGMGNITGSIIAATLITFLDIKLQTVLTGDLAVLQDLVYALILIVIVIYNNAPGLKVFRETYNMKKFFGALNRKKDDSRARDDEHKWDRVPTKIRMDEVLSVDIQTSSPYTPDKTSKEDK